MSARSGTNLAGHRSAAVMAVAMIGFDALVPTRGDGAIAAASPPVADAARDIPRAARGSASSITVRSAQPLQAKALRDASAPVLVRVNRADGGDTRTDSGADAPREYRVEFIGSLEGVFDLAEMIERTDGRPAEGLSDLRVEIYSQLPPNHGTDVFGLSAPGFSLSNSYTVTLWTLAAAWVAIPLVAVARRALRPSPPPPPAPAREAGIAERLLAILDEARGRELDTAERGRLELLLLRALREAGRGDTRDDGDLASLAAATAALRDDARDGPVVRAVEDWLHAPTAGDRTRALAALDTLRQLQPPIHPGGRA